MAITQAMAEPTLLRYEDVLAGLTDPRLDVPPARRDATPGTVAWLRAAVPRFSAAPDHPRRRALTEAVLATIDVTDLRRRATERTAALLRDGTPGRSGAPASHDGPEREVDLMRTIARPVPIGLLAESLGVRAGAAADAAAQHRQLTDDVVAVARVYLAPAEPDTEADRSVARLIEAFDGVADEPTAARIGILAQACDATAVLIANAVLRLLGPGAATDGRSGVPTDADQVTAAGRDRDAAIVDATVRVDPVAPVTRRRAIQNVHIGGFDLAAGDIIRVDLGAANRDPEAPGALTFGAGAHACPGQELAIAIAEGVLAAVRGRGLRLVGVEPSAEADPSATPRKPVRLTVAGTPGRRDAETPGRRDAGTPGRLIVAG